MIDRDTVDLCYLKVFLVGPPGVGKTTTLSRLLKAYENLYTAGDRAKCQSTLLANCTQVLAFVGQDESADWLSSNRDKDKESVSLIRYLCGDNLEETVQVEDIVVQRESKQVKENVDDRERLNPELGVQVDESAADYHYPLIQTTEAITGLSDKLEKKKSIKEQLRKLVRGGDFTEVISHLGNTLLNINDVGGQPGFLEMLPALSTGPAMYLVFLDLSKKLNQLYEITFDRDNTVITPFKSMHTVESTISQILSSIASAHNTPRESASLDSLQKFGDKFQKFQKIQPVAGLIGTHLDKLEGNGEKIKETSESLKNITKNFQTLLLHHHRMLLLHLFFCQQL